jgi:hypothetical protein
MDSFVPWNVLVVWGLKDRKNGVGRPLRAVLMTSSVCIQVRLFLRTNIRKNTIVHENCGFDCNTLNHLLLKILFLQVSWTIQSSQGRIYTKLLWFKHQKTQTNKMTNDKKNDKNDK